MLGFFFFFSKRLSFHVLLNGLFIFVLHLHALPGLGTGFPENILFDALNTPVQMDYRKLLLELPPSSISITNEEGNTPVHEALIEANFGVFFQILLGPHQKNADHSTFFKQYFEELNLLKLQTRTKTATCKKSFLEKRARKLYSEISNKRKLSYKENIPPEDVPIKIESASDMFLETFILFVETFEYSFISTDYGYHLLLAFNTPNHMGYYPADLALIHGGEYAVYMIALMQKMGARLYFPPPNNHGKKFALKAKEKKRYSISALVELESFWLPSMSREHRFLAQRLENYLSKETSKILMAADSLSPRPFATTPCFQPLLEDKKESRVHKIFEFIKNSDSTGILNLLIEEPWELLFLQDQEGDTPIHKAILNPDFAILEILLKGPPDGEENRKYQKPLRRALFLKGKNGETPLELALFVGKKRYIEALLESQADPLTALKCSGKLLNFAIIHKKSSLIKELCLRAPHLVESLDNFKIPMEKFQSKLFKFLEYILRKQKHIPANESEIFRSFINYCEEIENWEKKWAKEVPNNFSWIEVTDNFCSQ